MRRTLAAGTALALSLLTLSACGDDSDSGNGDGGGEALSSVTVEADPGNAPEVAWDGSFEPEGTESEVIVEGEGEEAETGDNVLAHIWIGNGASQEQVYSSYDEGAGPQLITINDSLLSSIKTAVEGRPMGSVVAVAAPAEDAYGEQGNPALGIGNKDSVLFVVELLELVANEPTGEERQPAAWAPALVEEDGTITGLDFSDAPRPNDKLRVSTLVEGEGAEVEKGQTIYVNYLGQVYKGEQPFDESYSRDMPVSFPIGVGQVVKGWDQALVGQTVGSRVLMAIPPRLGYGEKGSEGAGIKGTDTLYFVVDILAAQ